MLDARDRPAQVAPVGVRPGWALGGVQAIRVRREVPEIVLTMNDLLFDLAAVSVLSPRLAWIERHGIRLERDDSPDGREFGPWFACIPTDDACMNTQWVLSHGAGKTEDDALADLAANQGWRLWNEEGGPI